MTVAVVIPNLNYGRFIGRCLASVYEQTVQPNHVIVVDGYSKDQSLEVVADYAERFTRGAGGRPVVQFEVLFRQPRGMADARNYGIRQTDCDFIVPLDSDDHIAPTFIERCVERFRRPRNVPLRGYSLTMGIVGTALRWPDGRIQYPREPVTRETLLAGLDEPPYGGNRLFTCSMFRREAWEQVGGYDTAKTYEDWEFWLAIVSAGYGVEVVHEPLFFYEPHEGSSCDKMTPTKDRAYKEYIRRKHAPTSSSTTPRSAA